jgi:hypothetical protein
MANTLSSLGGFLSSLMVGMLTQDNVSSHHNKLLAKPKCSASLIKKPASEYDNEPVQPIFYPPGYNPQTLADLNVTHLSPRYSCE